MQSKEIQMAGASGSLMHRMTTENHKAQCIDLVGQIISKELPWIWKEKTLGRKQIIGLIKKRNDSMNVTSSISLQPNNKICTYTIASPPSQKREKKESERIGIFLKR